MITRDQVIEAAQRGNFDSVEGLDAVTAALNGLVASEPTSAERAQFLEAVERFRATYPDVVSDDSRYATAMDVDNLLALQHPHLPVHERLRIAGDEARKLADPWQRDRAVAINQLQQHHMRGRATAIDELEESSPDDDLDGTLQRYQVSADIELMARERRGHTIAQAQAQDERARQARRADYKAGD